MEETWKLLHEVKSNSKTHLKGDKYYISNKGRVKYNDIILDIGKGLYVARGELRIYGCPLPESSFHRTIYKLFVGNILYRTHQIHHKDYNHLNNAVDNLIQVTPKEHGDLHSSKDSINKTLKNKKIRDNLNNQIELLRKQSKLLFENYTKQRLDIITKQKRKEKEEIKKQLEQQKKQYIEDKLNKGWKLTIKGIPYDPERVKLMHTFHTEESHKKISESIKQRYKDDLSYRERVCKTKGKICINNGIMNKYINRNELNEYVLHGWVKGRKIEL